MAMEDELFETRNNFHIGNFAGVVRDLAVASHISENYKTEARALLCRSYIALKRYSTVNGEITDSDPAALQIVRLFSSILANNARGLQVEEQLQQFMESQPGAASDPICAVVAASIYLREQNYEAALKSVHGFGDLECRAIRVQGLLLMNRVDLAIQEVKSMHEVADDAVLTSLATAWTSLAMGGEKYQEAFYIYQELMDRYTPTSRLLTGQAACHMHQGRFEDADQLLNEAGDKGSGDEPEMLINMLVVAQHMGKPPEVMKRLMNQLKEVAADHPFVKELDEKREAFHLAAQQFSSGA
eukprot:Clim_evm27s77 gene=Clim_evmTU27s77